MSSEEGVEVSAPFGTLRGRGPTVIIFTLVLLVGFLTYYAVWKHGQDLTVHSEMTSGQFDSLGGKMDELIWVTCQGSTECKQYKLDMPPSLAKRVGKNAPR